MRGLSIAHTAMAEKAKPDAVETAPDPDEDDLDDLDGKMTLSPFHGCLCGKGE